MITIEKCKCGHDHCKYYHLIGIGTFYQGTGFTKDQAELIAAFLNGEFAEVSMVKEFNEKFGLADGSTDLLTNDEHLAQFRIKFLQEELSEFHHAASFKNRVDMFDALLDLAYVVYGTALSMGITPEMWMAGFYAVHSANMTKERAKSASQSKRGSAYDVVKPAGWVGPETRLEEILSWKS